MGEDDPKVLVVRNGLHGVQQPLGPTVEGHLQQQQLRALKPKLLKIRQPVDPLESQHLRAQQHLGGVHRRMGQQLLIAALTFLQEALHADVVTVKVRRGADHLHSRLSRQLQLPPGGLPSVAAVIATGKDMGMEIDLDHSWSRSLLIPLVPVFVSVLVSILIPVLVSILVPVFITVLAALLQADVVDDHAADPGAGAGQGTFGLRQVPLLGVTRTNHQHHAVHQPGHDLSVGHLVDGGQVDDDIGILLAETLDLGLEVGRSQHLRGVGRDLAHGDDGQGQLLHAEDVAGIHVGQQVAEAVLGMDAPEASHVGLAHVAVDEERGLAQHGEGDGDVAGGQALALGGVGAGHTEDAALGFALGGHAVHQVGPELDIGLPDGEGAFPGQQFFPVLPDRFPIALHPLGGLFPVRYGGDRLRGSLFFSFHE